MKLLKKGLQNSNFVKNKLILFVTLLAIFLSLIGITHAAVTVDLDIPANNSWRNHTPIAFVFTPISNDTNASFINCSLWGDFTGTWEPVSGNTTTITNNTLLSIGYSPDANGTFIWNIQCVNNASASNFSSVNYTLNIDTVSPVPVINSANNTWSTNETRELSFTLTDNLINKINYTIYVDGTAGQTGTATNNTAEIINLSAMTNGSHTIVVEAIDNASNKQNFSFLNITVDQINPTVSALNAPINNSNETNKTIVFNFTSYDNLDKNLNYTVYINGVKNTTGITAENNTFTNVTINITDGSYNYTVEVIDEAGNAVNFTHFYYFLVDTTFPNVTATAPSGTLTSGDLILMANTSENAACRYSTTDQNYTDMANTFTGTETTHNKSLDLANADYVYYVRCNDTYGNIMNSSTNITFTVNAQNLGGGGGGGGGGGSSTTPTVSNSTYIIFGEKDKTTAELTTSEIGQFSYKGDHELRATEIKEKSATLILKSQIYRFDLYLGQTKKFNIDTNTANYDLAVTLNQILTNSINVTLEKINEIIPAGEEPEAEIITEAEIPPLEVVEEPQIEPEPVEEPEKGINPIYIIGIVILIAIIIIVTIIIKKIK